MKRLIILTGIIIFFMSCGVVFAKSQKNIMPSLKFNGSTYYLYYSAKSKENGGYLNEYYKQNQTYASWNELIGVHHYSSAFYPMQHASNFSDYLYSTGVDSSLETDEEENSAVLYFTVTDSRKLPIIIEFNVFKYEKSPVCGTVALQYAKRYLASSAIEADRIRKTIDKKKTRYVKKVKKKKIPDIITKDVEKGNYVKTEAVKDNEEGLN